MFSLLHLLFGCPHNQYTFPITVKPGKTRPAAAALTGTYVVCLECAQEFPYDWREMKVVSRCGKNAGADCSTEIAARAA